MYCYNSCNYEYTLITPPSEFPVTLDEVKLQLNITGNEDDALLTTLIGTATEFVEKYLGRVLVTQTWGLFLSNFPIGNFISIAKRPLQSVTSVEYYPSDWNKSDPRLIFSNTNYLVTTATQGRDAGIELFSDSSWPNTYNIRQAILITFVAGQEPEDIPVAIKQAIMMIVAYLYENRGDCDCCNLPQEIYAILNQYRIIRIAC